MATRFWLWRSLQAAAVAAALTAAPAMAESYSIDAVHSSVGFSIRHLVSRTSGNFTDFSGTIVYDPAAPGKTAVEATIKVASIDTRNTSRDQHLKGDDFLNAAVHPEITFKSTDARLDGSVLQVTGNLTLHGVTRQITLPVEVLGIGTHPRNGAPVAGFASQVTIKRSDYGVDSWTDAAGVLGDEVRVELTMEAIGSAPSE